MNSNEESAIKFQKEQQAKGHAAMSQAIAAGEGISPAADPKLVAEYYRQLYNGAQRQVQEMQPKSVFEVIGIKMGKLVTQKNAQYGDSAKVTADMLRILYPEGVEPYQYSDMLLITRTLDKMCRISRGDQGDESAWKDITGYGILGTVKDENERHPRVGAKG